MKTPTVERLTLTAGRPPVWYLVVPVRLPDRPVFTWQLNDDRLRRASHHNPGPGFHRGLSPLDCTRSASHKLLCLRTIETVSVHYWSSPVGGPTLDRETAATRPSWPSVRRRILPEYRPQPGRIESPFWRQRKAGVPPSAPEANLALARSSTSNLPGNLPPTQRRGGLSLHPLCSRLPLRSTVGLPDGRSSRAFVSSPDSTQSKQGAPSATFSDLGVSAPPRFTQYLTLLFRSRPDKTSSIHVP